jgi:hypothetical protein
MSENAAAVALIALLVALPMGTTPMEVAAGLSIAVALAIAAIDRDFEPGPLAAPAVAVVAGWMLLALGPGGSPLASLGRTWALTPIFTVPMLLRAARPLPWVTIGTVAAGCLLPLVLAQAVGVVPGDGPPTGTLGHHLTLAYALIPAFAAACGERRPVALAIGASIALAGAMGGLAAGGAVLAVVVAGELPVRRAVAASGSVLVALGALLAPAFATDLRQRAILWTGGAVIALRGGTPPGTWRAVIGAVHHGLDPNFDFPQHAHDTSIQLAGDAGPAAWIGLAWAGGIVWTRGPGWLVAAAVGLTVAGLTQDWLGDLEVVRAVCVWTALGLALGTDPTAPESKVA